MGSKVLLADDSVTIQKVVGIIFANEGYELTVVGNGDAALQKAVEIKPDVILVDALMPGKNGYEVCREVRQNPAIAHTAILLMTGAFEAIDEEKSRQSGADEFITKPFESQALIEATNRMISLTGQRASGAVPSAPAMTEQVQSAPVATPVAAPAAPAQSVDDVWATGFDMEPAAESVAEPTFDIAAPVEEVSAVASVKVTSDEDLWGAFDMDAEAVSTPVQAAPADDMFSFEEPSAALVPSPADDEFVLEELALDEPEPVPVPTATGFEPVGEEEISFADFASEPAVEVQKAPAPIEEDFSSISFDEAPPAAPPVAETASFVQPFADDPGPFIAPAPAVPVPPPVPEPVAPAPLAAAPAASVLPASVSIDEAQLKELLSRVSRDVIERIVWEVVPDLAETIIKEEIRKLKAGIA